jgi:hypothetical protein
MIAVLTGDIVGSSGLQRVDQRPVSALIESVGQGVKRQFQEAIHAQVDIFRGDSWQMVIIKPALAVRIGLFFRALLRARFGMDSKVSIGFGEVDYLPQDDISMGTGQAFTLSGQGLESCRKPARMKLSLPNQESDLDGPGLNIIVQLIDLQASHWTPGQSQAVSGALLNLTQTQIAASWKPDPISQQAVSQHLDNAGWIQIEQALRYLEETLLEILGRWEPSAEDCS